MHSESLQFECKDMKHMTDKDTCSLQLNGESRVGEELTDHKMTNDLRDKGYMQYG